jgi:hypothetical protein
LQLLLLVFGFSLAGSYPKNLGVKNMRSSFFWLRI